MVFNATFNNISSLSRRYNILKGPGWLNELGRWI